MSKSSIKEIWTNRKLWFTHNWQYELTYYNDFDYSILKQICYYKKSGRGDNSSVNECWIMADTETSKRITDPSKLEENHVVAFTVSIRAFDNNICTLYGNRPTECIECLTMIHEAMIGDQTHIYFHNLAYDYVFLRQYMFKAWGNPIKQLNIKPHYPINIEFYNGIIIKDSLILAQRKLEKWGEDLKVEHTKSVGKWDYLKLRNQDHVFSPDELEYIEHDTLCGVECLNSTARTLNKKVFSMPYTATGIPREDLRNISKNNRGRSWFTKQALDYEQNQMAERVYHGGFTHANRFICGEIIDMIYTEGQKIGCRDFASSYPYAMMLPMPGEKFTQWNSGTDTIDNILKYSDEYAYMFTLCLTKVELKDHWYPMPYLQYSKCIRSLNAICDNGRIISADIIMIDINEIDLKIIAEQYQWAFSECDNIMFSTKSLLPKWFRDYIWKCYEDKCQLKGGDPVLYSIAKAKLNSLYGMCCQHTVKDIIEEDYSSGEFNLAVQDAEEAYNKYLHNRNSFLPYQIGCWVTSYAALRLFEMSKCIDSDKGEWLYSDTDSIYAYGWDEEKLEAFNQNTKQYMIDLGYGCVTVNGREYWLGIAEPDGEYIEFKTLHSKCYAKRNTEGKLSITVAGVPKKGVECLNDSLENFKPYFVFPGTVTGKQQHTYFFNEMHIDENGNEVADSIDLSPCDYMLNKVTDIDWIDLITQDISIQVYDEE